MEEDSMELMKSQIKGHFVLGSGVDSSPLSVGGCSHVLLLPVGLVQALLLDVKEALVDEFVDAEGA